MSAGDVFAEVKLPEPYLLRWLEEANGCGFRVCAFLPDVETGVVGWQGGAWRTVRPDDEPSNIVRAVFAAFLAFVEHEAREGFLYRGARVFGPHIDVDALVEVAGRIV